MKSEKKNETLYISLNGKIDSSNADAVEKELIDARAADPDGNIILDLEELSYISSAGLRIILRLRKKEPSLKLINASSEVYDIFSMTGFTEMIPIEKAYRRLSVDGCEVIGQGANGLVYRLDPDTIIKVYKNSDSLPDIQRERELARHAFIKGIPTAIPYDVVKVGESYGSVFELLNAKSLAKLIIANPDDIDKYIDVYVDLMKKIHETEVQPDEMPCMKEIAVKWAKFLEDYLPADKYQKLISLFEAVPDVHRMIHGDYHIKNVMIQDGEVLLIDMDTLCYGHPIFELGSIFNAYLGFSMVDHTNIEEFLGIKRETGVKIWKDTLKKYLDTDDENRIEEVEEKAMLVGCVRLLRRAIRRNNNQTETGKKEIEAYKDTILSILDKIDTLTF